MTDDQEKALFEQIDAAAARMKARVKDQPATELATRLQLARALEERDEARAVAEQAIERHNRMLNVITCAFCGHDYPEGTPASQHELLTAHILECEAHPLRKLLFEARAERDEARAKLDSPIEYVHALDKSIAGCSAKIEARLKKIEKCPPAPLYLLAQASTAAIDVLTERLRQITDEGWTPEHDDEHDGGELADAAACYAMHEASDGSGYDAGPDGDDGWVWPWDIKWWKPNTRRSNLVRAAALLIAEIERLDRAEASK